MHPDKVYFILFSTIHDVLKIEKLLKGKGIDCEVVPVPRSLSSDCGVCIKSMESLEGIALFVQDVQGVKYFLFDGVEYKTLKPFA